MARSPQVMTPESGLVVPVMMSLKVVSPAPLGPMTACRSAGPIEKARLFMAAKAYWVQLNPIKRHIL